MNIAGEKVNIIKLLGWHPPIELVGINGCLSVVSLDTDAGEHSDEFGFIATFVGNDRTGRPCGGPGIN
jgi:hypothetical protein